MARNFMSLLVVALKICIVPTGIRADEPSAIGLQQAEWHIAAGNATSCDTGKRRAIDALECPSEEQQCENCFPAHVNLYCLANNEHCTKLLDNGTHRQYT